MSKEWDRENMKSLHVNVKKDTAEAFRRYAEEKGTTVGALLRGFIESTVSGRPAPDAPPQGGEGGYWYLISYRIEDRLKHETAFHNPGGMTPTDMLAYVLDDYFEIADHFRRKSK